jgi:hypothetical protein
MLASLRKPGELMPKRKCQKSRAKHAIAGDEERPYEESEGVFAKGGGAQGFTTCHESRLLMASTFLT